MQNTTINCHAKLIDSSGSAGSDVDTTQTYLESGDNSQLQMGTYKMNARKSADAGVFTTATEATLYVYSEPVFTDLTPNYASYGDNVTLKLTDFQPWEYAIIEEGGLDNVKVRFISAGRADVDIQVASSVTATLVNLSQSLPLEFMFYVPMPVVGGDLLNNASQVQVSLNGQQFEATGQYFQFHDYCSGQVDLTAVQGELYDHPVERFTTGPPRPYSFCSWHISADESLFPDDAGHITVALQIEAGSQLFNVGFDYLVVYDGDNSNAEQLLRWPVDISDSTVVPSTIKSTNNSMLVQFYTGGFSADPSVYEGFSARYVATAAGTMSLLQIAPTAASSNSTSELTLTVSISSDLLSEIYTWGTSSAYECLFISSNDAATVCEAGTTDGTATVATLGADNASFACPLPPWTLASDFDITNVYLRGASADSPELPCTSTPRQLLFFNSPTLNDMSPIVGPVDTTIELKGSGLLDPNNETFADAGLSLVCRFEGSKVVTANFIDSQTITCAAPVPAQAGPNPVVEVEVSNNAFDWSNSLTFTYETYCGGTVELTQSVASFADHNGGTFSLPSSYCDFLIEPVQTDGTHEPGGVEISFDTLDVGLEDTVKLWRTNANGEYELVMDVAEYYRSANGPPASSLLQSRCAESGTSDLCPGLPAKLQYRTGRMTSTAGISVSYVTLDRVEVGVDSSGLTTYIYCALPTLSCPAVTTNYGFSASESSASASMLANPDTQVTGSVQVGGMVMHYFEIDSLSSAGVDPETDYRIVEVELELVDSAASASMVLVRQSNYTNSTAAAEATDNSCIDTTIGQSLESCPAGDYDTDVAQDGVVGVSTKSGNTIRLSYCIYPKSSDTPLDHEKIRLVVGVYGVVGGADGTNIVKYQVQYRAITMLDASGATLNAYDSSLVSGIGGNGGIGYLNAASNQIVQLLATLNSGDGRLLVRAGFCPTENEFDYGMQQKDNEYGLSIAECEQADTACVTESNAEDASGSATTLWFIGLYSTSGVDATNTSQATQVAMGSAEGHGYAALCDTAGTFTDTLGCGGEICTHLLAPNQTHHFLLKNVLADEVLKIDACITETSQDGAACFELADPGQLAVTIAPNVGECLTADTVNTFSDSMIADVPGGGHYWLSKCTVGSTVTEWRVSVTARIDTSSSYVPYRMVIVYQSANGDASLLDPGEAGYVEVTGIANAYDWSYYFLAADDDRVITIELTMELADMNAGDYNQAAVELHLSEVGCPGDVSADNVSASTNPILVETPSQQQQFFITLTPEPSDCYAETTVTNRQLYIGVWGASPTLIQAGGSAFSLKVTVEPLLLALDTPREVAVLAGEWVVLQVALDTLYALNVAVTVTKASDQFDTGTVQMRMMPKFDRDDAGTCGWPILQGSLLGTDTPAAADPQDGQSALPLTVLLGTVSDTLNLGLSVVENVKCSGDEVEDAVETWYLALSVPSGGTDLLYSQITISQSPKEFQQADAKDGNLLQDQWGHFQIVTSTEGTISLNVDIDCFGDCQAGIGVPGYNGVDDNADPTWKNAMLLVAQEDGDGSCPTGAEGTGFRAETGVYRLEENTVRYSVNLCTSGGGTYRVGLKGGADYGATWEGGGLGWQVTSASVAQSNLASFGSGESLTIPLSSGEWQYHYFELPDPTCAQTDSCLTVTTLAPAQACYDVDDLNTIAHEIGECKDANALFPADIQLSITPAAGASPNDVDVYVVLDDCGVALASWENLEAENDVFAKSYDSEQLLDEYLYAHLKKIVNTQTDPDVFGNCEITEIMSCAQCASRSGTGVCEDTTCCFTPKIYIAFKGDDNIPSGTEPSFQLEPALQCQAGYKAAGGTYAEACEPCPEGTYSKANAVACTQTGPGTYSLGGQASATNCIAGTYQGGYGQSECLACGQGYFQAGEGARECDECEAGTYNPLTEQIACTPCPNTFTSLAGSLFLDQCYCEPGYYKSNMQNAENEDDACLDCPADSYCRGGCEKNPSEIDCSETVAFPETFGEIDKGQVLGGLTWIPMAMPYPKEGYYQLLADDFSLEGAITKPELERTGINAEWWPFRYENTDTPMVGCTQCIVIVETMNHNNLEWVEPWWLNDFSLTYPDAVASFVAGGPVFENGQPSFGKSMQCVQGYWTYDGAAAGCDTCLAFLYFTKGATCEVCSLDLDPFLIVLLVIGGILIGALLVLASKVGFNWAAISISLNFLQVSAIFANFSIVWPEEVLAVLNVFNFFIVDVEVVQAECAFRISYFEKWFSMVMLPFVVVAMLSCVTFSLEFATFVMSKTRFPVWVKRKLWRGLKPPNLLEAVDPDEELADKLARKLKNLRRKLFYTVLSFGTKPIPRSKLESMQDTIFNAFVTMLSVYYMTGCKRSLEIFRCVKSDPILQDQTQCAYYDPGNETLGIEPDPPVALVYQKEVLFASIGSGEVTCSTYNATTCGMDTETGFTNGPGTYQLGIVGLSNSPAYAELRVLAGFFALLYSLCIPGFFFVKLTAGRHKLNHLNFGRRYGYLYKRYEVKWYWWECTVMIRKLLLNAVDIFIGLENGSQLPGQQAAAAMVVVIIFIMMQASCTPYAEAHLDALETTLLVVNYTFLFLGLCSYTIGLSADSSGDASLEWMLTVLMTAVLILGLLFMVLFLSLDITLQLVRLYFRFIEGEGKYGSRQQLVLTDLSAETRRLQKLAARILSADRQQLFQGWLNREATEDQKTLVKAAFTSLAYYLDTHEDHSMPWYVVTGTKLPIVGGLVAFGYQKQHQFWISRRAAKIRKMRGETPSSSMDSRRETLASERKSRRASVGQSLSRTASRFQSSRFSTAETSSAATPRT